MIMKVSPKNDMALVSRQEIDMAQFEDLQQAARAASYRAFGYIYGTIVTTDNGYKIDCGRDSARIIERPTGGGNKDCSDG